MKTWVIVNPEAGRARTRKLWPQVQQALQKTGWQLRAECSRRPGHATALAQAAVAAGAQRVIAVGGDGTLNEVVNGVAGSAVQVGVIPTGTGNDFARTVGISPDPLQAIAQMAAGREEKIDLAAAGGRYFINAAGMGLDARVAYLVNRGFRLLKGRAAYLAAVMQVFFSFKAVPLTLCIDGRRLETEALLVAVANGQYYGGGLKIAPAASVNNGKLDVCIIENLSRAEFIKHFPKLFSGTHVKLPQVSTYRAGEISIAGQPDVRTHIDGEPAQPLPLSFQALPAALTFIMPG